MIKDTGAWGQEEADAIHDNCSSANLPEWLAKFFDKDQPVVDFGCGKGRYIAELAKHGFSCTGVEGTQLNNFEHSNVVVHDLTQPLHLGIKGNVICLEVGEHLPKYAEQTLLNTIAEHAHDKVVMSWALPNQPGLGHVNCQPQDYIIKEMRRRGFRFLLVETNDARSIIEDNCDWFRRTLLVFDRKK